MKWFFKSNWFSKVYIVKSSVPGEGGRARIIKWVGLWSSNSKEPGSHARADHPHFGSPCPIHSFPSSRARPTRGTELPFLWDFHLLRADRNAGGQALGGLRSTGRPHLHRTQPGPRLSLQAWPPSARCLSGSHPSRPVLPSGTTTLDPSADCLPCPALLRWFTSSFPHPHLTESSALSQIISSRAEIHNHVLLTQDSCSHRDSVFIHRPHWCLVKPPNSHSFPDCC